MTAAFGHAGEVFQLTLANADYEFGRYDFSTISATSVAARYGDDIGELTAAEFLAGIKYLHGLTLATSADRLTLAAALTTALAAGAALPPTDGTSFCWCMRSGATAARISRITVSLFFTG